MKILVTGSNGQVGFCLNNLLRNTQWNFKALTRDQLDISNSSAVNDVVAEFQPDIIINAAAYTAVDKAESDKEQAYKINSEGAKNLAVAANRIDAAIFHISTDYVFAGDSNQPYSEDAAVGPQGVYGASKLKGEEEVKAANAKHIIMRTSWVFCEHGNNFVKTMIRLGRDREQLGIVGDQVGGPTYAGDIADALLKIAAQYEKNKNIPWGVYHFSGLPHISWFEFASAIFNEVGVQKLYSKELPLINAISTSDYPTPAKRPANSRLNCEKIQIKLDIQPSDWMSALKNIKAYC